jgi:hypothetical protein
MYHIVFIHSLVVGHLGWFRVLAIVNSAAIMQVCRHLRCMLTCIPLDVCLRVVQQDPAVALLLVPWRLS